MDTHYHAFGKKETIDPVKTCTSANTISIIKHIIGKNNIDNPFQIPNKRKIRNTLEESG